MEIASNPLREAEAEIVTGVLLTTKPIINAATK